MFGRKRDRSIDAQAELAQIDGEPGPSDVGMQRRPIAAGGKALMATGVIAVGATGLGLSYIAWQQQQAGAEKSPLQVVRQVIPALEIKPPLVQPTVSATTPEPEPSAQMTPVVMRDYDPFAVAAEPPQYTPPAVASPAQKSPEQLLLEQRMSSGFGPLSSAPQTGGSDASLSAPSGGGGGDPFADRLNPTRLKPSRAGLMDNRDMVITQGTSIPCVMQTAIVTTQPGMAVCQTVGPTYSTSGRVDLIPPGTKVVGFAKSGIAQGQARVFVAWSRLETRDGVIIDLDSPGTGPLGEPGIGGHVDTHFWQRFGGAVILSLIEGSIQAAANAAAPSGGGNQINLGGSVGGIQQAATEALRNSINIPPTLSTQPGQRVQIMVARDMDFSDVYELEPR